MCSEENGFTRSFKLRVAKLYKPHMTLKRITLRVMFINIYLACREMFKGVFHQ
jgi:hypothetical protein